MGVEIRRGELGYLCLLSWDRGVSERPPCPCGVGGSWAAVCLVWGGGVELSPFPWGDLSSDAAVPPPGPILTLRYVICPPACGLQGAEGTEVSVSPPHPLHPRAQPEPPAIGDWKCLQPRPWAGIRVGAAAPAVPFPPPSMHPLPALCHCNGELGGGGGSVLHPLPSLPACCWGEASLPPSASPLPPLPTSPHTDGGWVGFWCHPSDPHCAHWVPTPPSPPPPRAKLPPMHAWCSWLCCSSAPSALLSCIQSLY